MKRKAESADALEDGLDYEVGSDAAGDEASIDNSEEEAPSMVEKKVVSAEERRAKRKERHAMSKKRKREEGEAEGPAIIGVDQQADIFAKLIRDNVASKDLSSIELSDLYLPAAAFVDTSMFTEHRDLTTLASFLDKFTEREFLKVANKENGRPHTIFLSPSAIRVADVSRALKHLKTKTGEPAKLFGKEKLSAQAVYLAKTRINVAVGVPGRVLGTMLQDALKTDRVQQIYLDSSYLDSKKRGILKIKEVTTDLIKILQHDTLARRIKEGECKIILF